MHLADLTPEQFLVQNGLDLEKIAPTVGEYHQFVTNLKKYINCRALKIAAINS